MVISDALAKQAASYSTTGSVRRLAGPDRYETAARIAAELPANVTPAYVASGQAFPDALVGAALAGRRGVPLVLTPPDRVRIPAPTGR
jgi:putative cell wall-binding protein